MKCDCGNYLTQAEGNLCHACYIKLNDLGVNKMYELELWTEPASYTSLGFFKTQDELFEKAEQYSEKEQKLMQVTKDGNYIAIDDDVAVAIKEGNYL